jgi:neutral ceramidase
VNFALHLDTVGGVQISADYPYELGRILAAVKGPRMLTMFGLGTCGDINHVDTASKRPQKGHGEAARIGTILASEVLRGYDRLAAIAGNGVEVRSALVKLQPTPISAADLQAAQQVAARVAAQAEPRPSTEEQAKAFRAIDVAAMKGRPIEVEVQVIAVGRDLAWVSLPGEIFVELGLAIKNGSPFKHTFINELANGSIGYVPTRQAYAQGAYEVFSARCAAGSGELLVDKALELLRAARGESRSTLTTP